MDYPNDKGITNRQNLSLIWEQTDQKPEQYRDIEVPYSGIDLWEIFWDMRSFMKDGLTWMDVYGYCQLYNVKLKPYELKILQRLNYEAEKWIRKKVQSTVKPNKKPIKPARKK